MRLSKGVLLAAALLWLAGAIAGCGRSNLRIGWLESGGPGHRTARFRMFRGIERTSFRVEEGETVVIDYEVLVRKGTLTLSLLDPDGETLWEEWFEEAEGEGGEPEIAFSGDHELESAPQTGRYQLLIEGQRAGGSFDLSWEVGDG